MRRARALTGIGLVTSLVALVLLLWPVQGQLGGRSISCGVPALWIIHVGFDPYGPGDLPGMYDEFLACRDVAVPRAVAGWLTTTVAIAVFVGAAKLRARHRRGRPERV